MDVFDVPGEQRVDQSVGGHHEQDELEAELIVLDRRHADVRPLNADAGDLVERKVLGAEAERRRRQQRLHPHTHTHTHTAAV